MANDKREQAVELNRDGLTGYYEQMAEDDGTIKTTVEWLVDMSLLIQDDVGKRLKAKWSPCCPRCNFKRIENDSSHFVTFSEEYCGNRECDCHGARHAAATAEGIPQADGLSREAELRRNCADELSRIIGLCSADPAFIFDEMTKLAEKWRGSK